MTLKKPEPESCPYCGENVEYVDETSDSARYRCSDCGIFAVSVTPGLRAP